jgi:uncharacterized protein with PQ loop repeat
MTPFVPRIGVLMQSSRESGLGATGRKIWMKIHLRGANEVSGSLITAARGCCKQPTGFFSQIFLVVEPKTDSRVSAVLSCNFCKNPLYLEKNRGEFMTLTIMQIIEKYPAIGYVLSGLIFLLLPAILVVGLVKSIRRKSKKGIIVFSCLNLCFILFVLYLIYSIYLTFCAIKMFNQESRLESERIHNYKVQEIESSEVAEELEKGDFPIVKINEGLVIGGEYDKAFKFYNKQDYKITAFVFYIDGFEVYVESDFLPGHFYEINFENIQRSYTIKDVGVFYRKGDGEKSEVWTDQMEDRINSLFVKK